MESRLEKIFSMGINIMSLAVWLGEDRKCSAAVVGLDLLLGNIVHTKKILLRCVDMYSAANDPRPQMIPRPEMIPKLDRK